MGIYAYKATDSRGKIVKGNLEAKDELDVSTQLAKLNYVPINISFKGEKAPPLLERLLKKGVSKASTKALIVFTRQFATIVKAAVPIMEGLGVLAEQAEDLALKEALHQVIHDIEEGARLSEAMAKHPAAFDRLYVSMVKAGETSGALDATLMRLATQLEKQDSLRRSIKSANSGGVMSRLRLPMMVSSACA